MPGKALHLYLGLVDNILRITTAPVHVYVSSGPVSSPSRLVLEGISVVVVAMPSISPEIWIRVIGVVSPSQLRN